MACRLAHAHLGTTAPNPTVGCVIVADEAPIAAAVTAKSGRPHAETQALATAGPRAQGADVYVTLEPCAHQGQTGPCAQALIDARVGRVIVACQDPNPAVAGKGIAMLKASGIAVTEGCFAETASRLHEGFFTIQEKHRPMISVKIATSSDGKMTGATGESQWITGAKARRFGHLLRARHDAIVTGIQTVLKDDPQLTCRIAGLEADSPIRIVLDRQGRLPANARLQQRSDRVPLWRMEQPDLPSVLAELANRGITRLLVEAGPTLTTAFLTAGLADWLYWFKAPLLIGSGGQAAIGELESLPLSSLPRMTHQHSFSLGEDRCDLYRL